MKGAVIKYARQSLGLTQAALARQIGSTQLSITKWETDTHKPSPENERRLKQALGLDETVIADIEELLRDGQHTNIKIQLHRNVGAEQHNI